MERKPLAGGAKREEPECRHQGGILIHVLGFCACIQNRGRKKKSICSSTTAKGEIGRILINLFLICMLSHDVKERSRADLTAFVCFCVKMALKAKLR